MTKEKLKKYHQKVRSLLDKQPKPPKETIAFLARYVGGVNHEKRKPDEQSKLIYLGLKIPESRAIYKELFLLSDSSQALNNDEKAIIWNYIFKNSDTFEEQWLSLNFFNQKEILKIAPRYWKFLKTWVKHIDNWAHSDTLSGIYATILETDHKKYLPFFEKLNKSKNPWERRQSVVGLYFYRRFRKNPLPAKIGLKFVQNLLDDKHIYVQKGVGWTLREIYQVDKKAQVDFVRKFAKKIAPAGYYATVEKYPQKLKNEIKLLRMKNRMKNKKRTQ
jgi:3-methyladenine DNA glycosylase AlkD